MFGQRDCMRTPLFHSLRRDGPDAFVEVDICPSSGGRLGGAGHGMKLPFDQAAGRPLDTGVRDFHHELRKLIRWQRGHIFFLGFLKYRSNAAERIGKDHSGVDPVGHDLVKALAHSLNRLEAAFGLNRTKQLDDLRGQLRNDLCQSSQRHSSGI